jgi:hypothetical protein
MRETRCVSNSPSHEKHECWPTTIFVLGEAVDDQTRELPDESRVGETALPCRSDESFSGCRIDHTESVRELGLAIEAGDDNNIVALHDQTRRQEHGPRHRFLVLLDGLKDLELTVCGIAFLRLTDQLSSVGVIEVKLLEALRR